jgi:hypothetical protein
MDPTTKRKSRNPNEYDADLEWFLVAGASAMRERGTLGAVTNVLELGGANGGVPNTDLYTDSQIGFGKHPIGDVERHRWLSAAWFKLSLADQAILAARYMALPAEAVQAVPQQKPKEKPHQPVALRGDSGFGARDTCPSVEEVKRGGVKEPAMGRHTATRSGTESLLGEYASLVFWLSREPGKLLAACREPDKGGGRVYAKKAVKRAREASFEAHRAWQEAKTGRPRKKRERVAVLPAFVHAEATE